MSEGYATEHADALEAISAAGDMVVVTDVQKTYTAATDSIVDTPSYISGYAVEVPGDPEQYQGLGLVEQRPRTLVFVGEFYVAEQAPAVGDTIEWDGADWTIRHATPVRPDGTPIVTRLVVVQ